MIREPTPTQRRVLSFIRSHLEIAGMPPTASEIAKVFHWSSATAARDHLRALAKRGLVELIPRVSRGIRVLEQEEVTRKDLCGKCASDEGATPSTSSISELQKQALEVQRLWASDGWGAMTGKDGSVALPLALSALLDAIAKGSK